MVHAPTTTSILRLKSVTEVLSATSRTTTSHLHLSTTRGVSTDPKCIASLGIAHIRVMRKTHAGIVVRTRLRRISRLSNRIVSTGMPIIRVMELIAACVELLRVSSCVDNGRIALLRVTKVRMAVIRISMGSTSGATSTAAKCACAAP